MKVGNAKKVLKALEAFREEFIKELKEEEQTMKIKLECEAVILTNAASNNHITVFELRDEMLIIKTCGRTANEVLSETGITILEAKELAKYILNYD